MRFLRAPDTPSGATAPPRFRPGADVRAYRAHYGAARTAQASRDTTQRRLLALLAVAACAAVAAFAAGAYASPNADLTASKVCPVQR